jgi:hypothetical protein
MMATVLSPSCSMLVYLAAVKTKMVAKATPAVSFSSRKSRGRSGELGLWVCPENFHGLYSRLRTRSMR